MRTVCVLRDLGWCLNLFPTGEQKALNQRDTKQVFWGWREEKSGVWKSFPTQCLYTEPMLLFRWCSDTARCYGNTYTLARHTRDRAGDRWGHDAFFLAFLFLTETAFLSNGSFPSSLSVQYRMDRRRFSANQWAQQDRNPTRRHASS